MGINLLTGILVGLALALAKALVAHGLKFHHLEIKVSSNDETRQTHMILTGAATFVRLPRLAARLEKLPLDHEVLLDVDELEYIDHACLQLLDRWECERIRKRAPVRVQWQTLHHRYHAKNPLDRTPDEYAGEPGPQRRLLDFLTPERIMLHPSLTDKWSAIHMLCAQMVKLDPSLDMDALEASVRAREHEASTCLGHGLMIPHGSLADDRTMIGVMALSREGWEFDSPDGTKIHCVLLLATPPHEASRHLAVLASFARLFMKNRDLSEKLLDQSEAADVLALLYDERAKSVNYAFERRNESSSAHIVLPPL